MNFTYILAGEVSFDHDDENFNSISKQEILRLR